MPARYSPLMLAFTMIASSANAQEFDVFGTDTVPFVGESYIIQGFGALCEAGQACGTERLYASFYWKNVHSQTGGAPSTVAEYQTTPSMVMTRCFRLDGRLGYSHVGGLAIVGDYMYVASDWYVEKYRLPMAYVPVGDGWMRLPGVNAMGRPYTTSACIDIHAEGVWRVKASSFVSTTLDGGAGLLLGRWCPDDENCSYQNGIAASPYAYLYRLNANGDIAVRDERETTSAHCPGYNPSFATERCEDWVEKYRLPFNAQGVAYVPNNDELAVSVSAGRQMNAYIRLQPVVVCPRGSTCSVPAARKYIAVVGTNIMKGWEDLVLSRGRLWTASELSALYFGPYYETTNIFYVTSPVGDW